MSEKEKGVVIKKLVEKNVRPMWLNLSLGKFDWMSSGVFATRFPRTLAEKFVKFLNDMTQSFKTPGDGSRDLEFFVCTDPEPNTQSVDYLLEHLDRDINSREYGRPDMSIYNTGEKLAFIKNKRFVNQKIEWLVITPEKIRWNIFESYATLFPLDLAEELVDFLNLYVEEIRENDRAKGQEENDILKGLTFYIILP